MDRDRTKADLGGQLCFERDLQMPKAAFDAFRLSEPFFEKVAKIHNDIHEENKTRDRTEKGNYLYKGRVLEQKR